MLADTPCRCLADKVSASPEIEYKDTQDTRHPHAKNTDNILVHNDEHFVHML